MSSKMRIFVNYMAQFRANTTERYLRVQLSNKYICFITILKLNAVFYIFFIKNLINSLWFYRYLLTLLRNHNHSSVSKLRQ